MSLKRFPVLDAPTLASIPWAMIAPHEAQVQLNHDQSLERLAERGGLSACEALCAMKGTDIRPLFRPGHGHRGVGVRRVELCSCIEALSALAMDYVSGLKDVESWV